MARPINPAYNELLAGTYRRIARVIAFEMEVQGLQQTDVSNVAAEIAAAYHIPIQAKANSIKRLLNALLNDKFLEMVRRLPVGYDPVKATKLENLTPERLGCILRALGLSPADFRDRFLIHLPHPVAAVLDEFDRLDGARMATYTGTHWHLDDDGSQLIVNNQDDGFPLAVRAKVVPKQQSSWWGELHRRFTNYLADY